MRLVRPSGGDANNRKTLLPSRAVEVAFKKPRFFRFFKNLKNPKVQILGFLVFCF